MKEWSRKKPYLGSPLLLIVSLCLGISGVDVRGPTPPHQGAVAEGDRQQDYQEENADHQQHLLNLQVCILI